MQCLGAQRHHADNVRDQPVPAGAGAPDDGRPARRAVAADPPRPDPGARLQRLRLAGRAADEPQHPPGRRAAAARHPRPGPSSPTATTACTAGPRSCASSTASSRRTSSSAPSCGTARTRAGLPRRAAGQTSSGSRAPPASRAGARTLPGWGDQADAAAAARSAPATLDGGPAGPPSAPTSTRTTLAGTQGIGNPRYGTASLPDQLHSGTSPRPRERRWPTRAPLRGRHGAARPGVGRPVADGDRPERRPAGHAHRAAARRAGGVRQPGLAAGRPARARPLAPPRCCPCRRTRRPTSGRCRPPSRPWPASRCCRSGTWSARAAGSGCGSRPPRPCRSSRPSPLDPMPAAVTVCRDPAHPIVPRPARGRRRAEVPAAARALGACGAVLRQPCRTDPRPAGLIRTRR